jgi:hypothetical protein
MNGQRAAENQPSRRLRRVAITIACIVVGAIAGLMVFALTTGRRPPPPMARSDFEAAVQRWHAHRPRDYTMTIELSGRQSGTMAVVVKNGETISVQRNGVPTPERTWKYWTVDGLFDNIRLDLEGLDQPERAFGVGDVSQLVQQAEFDTELGYPRRYRRAVQTTGDAIEWEVIHFEAE